MTFMKRYSIYLGALFGTTLMGFAYLIINGIPKYLAGDDFILQNASITNDGYASSIVGCVNDIGSEKWRPMFVCTVTPILKIFGDQYRYYFLLNLVLIFLICVVAAELLKAVTKLSGLSIAVFALILPFSRFTWYGRISPFGLMEFGALLFALLFLKQFLRALDRKKQSAWYLSAGFACVSSLFHERYLVLLAAGFLVAVLNIRNKRIPVPITPWLLFPGSYIATKLFLLRVDPIAGGGETPIRSSANTWILEHFLIGVKALMGIGNGTNIGFDPSGYLRQPGLGLVGKFWLLAVTTALALICTWKAFVRRRVFIPQSVVQMEFIEQQIVMRQLLLISGLFLIVPASTVISRIEGRWLLGPEVILLILVIGIMKSEIWRIMLCSCYLIFSLICLQFLSDYEQPIRTTNEILEYVHEQLDGKTQLIYTIIDPRDRINLLDWQLGRSAKFNQLGLEQIKYVEPDQCLGSCIKLVFENTERFNLITHPVK